MLKLGLKSFYAETGPPGLFMLKLGLQVFLCWNWASRSFYAQTGPPSLFMLKLGLQVFLCSNWASKSFYAQTEPPGLFMLRHHCPLFLSPSFGFSGTSSPLLFIVLPLVSSLRSTLETFVFSHTNVSRVRAWWVGGGLLLKKQALLFVMFGAGQNIT